MSRTIWFITHPEVRIDPAVPIDDWGLSPRGAARMRVLAAMPWTHKLGTIWSSTERKAREAAEILAGPRPVRHLATLGENDRSATGFLPRAEFERTADAFFARPDESVRGWETARDAQARIVAALGEVVEQSSEGDIAIVAHGAVGALLLCHLQGQPISRAADQPGDGGGHLFALTGNRLLHGWRCIDG